MKRIITYLSALLLTASCGIGVNDPYEETLCILELSVSYPEDYQNLSPEGVKAKVEDINLGSIYNAPFGADGTLSMTLPCGLYRVSVSDMRDMDIFNATADRIVLGKDGSSLGLKLKHSRGGSIVIKEIYCGGCRKAPEEGNYQADQYVILHNNGFTVQYLDSLCFGSLFPYNANASNPFVTRSGGETVFTDYLPIADAVWMFPGNGHSWPLQPGEDAVLCVRGAIDHAASFPLSVNLDKKEYFVMYNSNYFTNQNYNPVPGKNIQDDHILECLVKTNPTVNATMMSMNSPAVVLYRAKGTSMKEYIGTSGALVTIPGSSNNTKVLACPEDWVLDAVEVFNGQSSANMKRFKDVFDAGYVTLSNVYLGATLMRKTDEESSSNLGYEVLKDTNNSSEDFYQTEKQSLHE